MSNVVRRIPLEQGVPGMVLAEQAMSGAGIVLLQPGTAMTEKHLASLRLHDIAEIAVFMAAAKPDTPAASDIAASQETEKKRVEQLFRRAGPDPLMQTLFQTVLAFRLERLK